MNYNDLATYFVDAAIHFKHIYIQQLPPSKQGKELSYHFETAGLVIPLEGKLTLTVDDSAYLATAGDIMHISKGKHVTTKNNQKKDSKVAFIYFEALGENPKIYEQFKVEIGNVQAISRSVASLKNCANQPAVLAAFKCQVLFYTLLDQIVEGMCQSVDISTSVEEVLQYIHEHYKQPLSVTDIADYFSIERRHLAYIFKRHTGVSPLNYLTEYRIRMAKELLRQPEYPIMKVAALIGIEDNLYFSRIFKKRTGLSPTAYRESCQTVHN